MGALANTKHERFAQAMASVNPDPRAAYVSAGFIAKNDHTASVCASTLLKRKEIKARILELTQESRNQLAKNIEEKLGGNLDEDWVTRAGRAKTIADVRRRMHLVMQDRAAAPEHQDLPGGKSGLVVLKGTKVIKSKVLPEATEDDPNPQPVEQIELVKIAAADTKFISALLQIDQQIARELGQWVEKTDSTVEIRNISDLSDEMLDKIIAAADLEEARKRNSSHSIQ